MAVVLWIFLAVVVIYLIVSFILFRMVCGRFPNNRSPFPQIGSSLDELLKPYEGLTRPALDWIGRQKPKKVSITSYDGLKLAGLVYENPNARGVLISCHGYRSTGLRDFASACSYYYGRGFTILLIDERATGESEGNYITFGIRERFDVQDWCRFMAEQYPNLPIALGGISMGASAVLMATPELPDAVVAVLADCGFDSPWDELTYVIHHYIHLAATPLLRGIDLWCRLLAGFSLRQYSAAEALAWNTRPVLFIHGEADDLVPPENTVRTHRACTAPCMLLTVPNAGHGMSYLVDTDGYHAAVEEFLRRYVFPAAPASDT